MTDLCVWCGVEPAIDRVELTVAKEKVLVPLCWKHYAGAVLYEQYGQSFLRGVVQAHILPRGTSRTWVPRVRTGVRRKR